MINPSSTRKMHSNSDVQKSNTAKPLRRMARALMRNAAGNAALSFAIAAPAVLAVVGIASDFAMFSMKRTELQAFADQAAIAAANELVIGNTSSTAVMSAASAYQEKAVNDASRKLSTDVSHDEEASAVTVKLQEDWSPFFAHFIGVDMTPIKVSATASLVGESKICVLALEGKNVGAIAMTKSAFLQADGCSVYSNSTHSAGVFLADASQIQSPLVCSVGGVSGYGVNSADKVMTDCKPISDPLAGRPTPSFGACNQTKFAVSSGAVSLKPGVYCGGLNISGTAKVTFEPGEYIIKDGPFLVRDKAEVTGTNTGFYFTGNLSTVMFIGDAMIDLSGAEDGKMAGLLFFEDPASGPFRIHAISASRARNLTGTIYLPKGNLLVDPNSSVGAESAYTAILAKRLIVNNGPRLVLNSNYSATKVPVPAGIKSAAKVVLTD